MTESEDEKPRYASYMSSNRRYICPECGAGGGHPKEMKPPMCHECHERGDKVVMKPFTYN